MNKEMFLSELAKLGISLTDKQIIQFEDYYNLIIEWNKKINLTTITDIENVYLKHFYDSLTIYNIYRLNDQKICDIGTGAGFPGIPLKIVFPNLKVTLVDSLGKRCNFLKEVINVLNLDNVEIVNERAEIFSNKNRELYDIVTARAVAPLSQLLEISIGAIKVNGYFIAMKTTNKNELENLNNCLKELSLSLEKKQEFQLPLENSNRLLLLFKKNTKTNKNYPRKYNIIKKNPL